MNSLMCSEYNQNSGIYPKYLLYKWLPLRIELKIKNIIKKADQFINKLETSKGFKLFESLKFHHMNVLSYLINIL